MIVVRFLLHAILACFLINCQTLTDNNTTADGISVVTDTTIVHWSVLQSWPGNASLQNATQYALRIGHDTLAYRPVFTQSIDSETITLHLNLPYQTDSIDFATRLAHLAKILPEVFREFASSQLSSVVIGRLILTGDLALIISKEYLQRNMTTTITTHDYKDLADFLMSSSMVKIFNEWLAPHHLKVINMHLEKAILMEKESFLKSNIYTTTEVDNYPTEILDAITSLEIEEIR